jgi:hypothetical protein
MNTKAKINIQIPCNTVDSKRFGLLVRKIRTDIIKNIGTEAIIEAEYEEPAYVRENYGNKPKYRNWI